LGGVADIPHSILEVILLDTPLKEAVEGTGVIIHCVRGILIPAEIDQKGSNLLSPHLVQAGGDLRGLAQGVENGAIPAQGGGRKPFGFTTEEEIPYGFLSGNFGHGIMSCKGAYSAP
jgi:hypothetical protein